LLESFRAHMDVLWGFLVALAVVLVLTPGVGRIGRVLGVVDEPGERRRLHVRPVPRLGGIALFLGIVVPALAFLDLSGPWRGILLGGAVAVTVGLVDDFRGLPWWAKLGGQGAAAGVAVASGITVDRFTFPFLGIHDLSPWIGVPATLLWIVALMNMVNFLDGLDGLAAGIAAISGADLHGRLGGDAARLRARDGRRAGTPEDGGDGGALLPAARAGDPDPRHVLRRRQAAQARRAALRRRPGS